MSSARICAGFALDHFVEFLACLTFGELDAAEREHGYAAEMLPGGPWGASVSEFPLPVAKSEVAA